MLVGHQDAGAGGEDGARRARVVTTEPVDQLRAGSLHLPRVHAPLEELAAAAADRTRQVESLGIGNVARGGEDRSAGEAAVEHLRLRKEEGVLALDVPGREIVPGGV